MGNKRRMQLKSVDFHKGACEPSSFERICLGLSKGHGNKFPHWPSFKETTRNLPTELLGLHKVQPGGGYGWMNFGDGWMLQKWVIFDDRLNHAKQTKRGPSCAATGRVFHCHRVYRFLCPLRSPVVDHHGRPFSG